MNLFNQAVSASNNFEMTKTFVTNEIVNQCAEYIFGQKFEDYIKGRLAGDTIEKRELTIYVSFWAYHSGCSTTNFTCGPWVWTNPEASHYSFDSRKYKGVELREIHINIVQEMCNMVKARMQEFGFSNIHIIHKINNLGYAEYEVITRW